MKRIIITTGDTDGIGLEIAAKALVKLGPQQNIQFVLFRSTHKTGKWQKLIKQKFKLKAIDDFLSISKESQFLGNTSQVLDIVSEESPAKWFKDSVLFCKNNLNSAIVTGPVSKSLFHSFDPNILGHTGMLKKIFPNSKPQMGFIGRKFCVVLATDHIKLSEVSQSINIESLNATLINAQELNSHLVQSKKKNMPIGILGLNPHAGDNNLIGSEDRIIANWVQEKSNIGLNLIGPLVPDVAFQRTEWAKYSLYIALYHDQGLIPFKLVHGQDSGVHLTLGIPILRTSVDHGTAKDIFNKDAANPNSMIDCLKYTIHALKTKDLHFNSVINSRTQK